QFGGGHGRVRPLAEHLDRAGQDLRAPKPPGGGPVWPAGPGGAAPGGGGGARPGGPAAHAAARRIAGFLS
ncbi:hypothetical protein, partial [Nocardia farcinica]|uniref:hypothetical protein n=1 Tax=Nocardia farcinica TaxID=37329 RepID=UPI00245680A3